MALVLAPRHVPIAIRHPVAGPLELMCLVSLQDLLGFLDERMTLLWSVVATCPEMGCALHLYMIVGCCK